MTTKQPTGIRNIIIIGLAVLLCLVWMIAADRVNAAPVNPTDDLSPLLVQCANGRSAKQNCPQGQSLILFEENFDAQPDWYATGTNCGLTQPSANCPNSDVPASWSYYRNGDDLWRPDNGYPSNQYGQRISGDVKRGATGKSWIKSSEANKALTTSNYYSDAILMKKLTQSYNEMYLEFWVLTQPGWQWQQGEGGKKLKLARIGHLDDIGSGDVFDIGNSGNSAPLYIFDFYNHDVYGWQHSHAPRCDPQLEEYLDCGTAQYTSHWTDSWYFDCKTGMTCTGFTPSADGIQRPTFDESVGDGQWHKIGLYVKLNSAPGVEDGVFKFWMDDYLEWSITDVPFREIGSPNDVGWNFISIGGNWNNWFSDPINEAEQWYAIDDIRVCSTELCQ